MKRTIFIITLFVVSIMVTACRSTGVSQDEYDLVIAERDKAISEKDSAIEKHEALLSQYDEQKVKIEEYEKIIEPYKTLSESDLQMKTNEANLKAEEDRIALELIQKQEAEEKSKKEKEEAEQKAAKEKEEREAKEKEDKLGYNTGIFYDQLARNPDDYKGKKVKFTGEVLQVMEAPDYVHLRFAVNSDYDNVLYLEYTSSIVSSRILEDDIITIYGTSYGLYSYNSTLGGEITIPCVIVDKIDQ